MRPSKLSPTICKKITDTIRAGNYAYVAAQYAGIGESTFYRWLAQGQADAEGAYREFWEQVKQAEAESEVKAVELVNLAMTESWQAAMTYLERRYPDRWRKRGEIDVSKLTVEQLLGLARAGQATTDSPGDRLAGSLAADGGPESLSE